MNQVSSLFQEEDREVISSIFSSALSVEDITEIQLLKGGMFNTTYQVRYGEPGKTAVLRLGPVNRHLLMRFEENLMEAEAYVQSLFTERGIPGTKVLFCDTTKKLVNRDYMILEYIHGQPLTDNRIPEKERLLVHEETGTWISEIHRIRGTEFGYVSRILEGKGCKSWRAFFTEEVLHILSKLLELEAVTREEGNLIEKVLQEGGRLLDTVKTPFLTHGDLWDGNILVRREADRYRVAALIDADRAVFGDRDFELFSPWMTDEAFFRGYGIGIKELEKPDRSEKMKLYRMYYCLVEAYVGIGEYNNTEQYENGKEHALKRARQIIDGR